MIVTSSLYLLVISGVFLPLYSIKMPFSTLLKESVETGGTGSGSGSSLLLLQAVRSAKNINKNKIFNFITNLSKYTLL
jgi:hypothetical protein